MSQEGSGELRFDFERMRSGGYGCEISLTGQESESKEGGLKESRDRVTREMLRTHVSRRLRERQIGSYKVIERGLTRCFRCGSHLAMNQMQAEGIVLDVAKASYFKNGCMNCLFGHDEPLPGVELASRDCFSWWYTRGEPRDYDDWGEFGDV